MKTMVIDDRTGQRLDNFLFGVYRSTPNSHVYRMLRKGRIRVNGKVMKDNTYKLCEGDVLTMPTPVNDASQLKPSETLINKCKAMIVSEHEDYWVLNKPQGICVHQSQRDIFGVVEVMREIYGEAHLVHRIDRNTSGCLIVAKSYRALNQLQAYWKKKQVTKVYWLLCVGHWKYGAEKLVDKPLLRVDQEKAGPKVMVSENGKEARSTFKLLKQYKGYALLEARIETGRTHQIRVHAASIGLPIVGDGRYGKADNPFCKYMFLHARQLVIEAEDIDETIALTKEQQEILLKLDKLS